MRLFQNSGVMRAYRPRLWAMSRDNSTFSGQLHAFMADRFGALHHLLPVIDGSPDAFYTNGDDERLQRAWARENGLSAKTPLEEILLAQIEAHRTDVFYNPDPVRYPSSFVRRLPASVKRKIAWRAAPSGQLRLRRLRSHRVQFPVHPEILPRPGMAVRILLPGPRSGNGRLCCKPGTADRCSVRRRIHPASS